MATKLTSEEKQKTAILQKKFAQKKGGYYIPKHFFLHADPEQALKDFKKKYNETKLELAKKNPLLMTEIRSKKAKWAEKYRKENREDNREYMKKYMAEYVNKSDENRFRSTLYSAFSNFKMCAKKEMDNAIKYGQSYDQALDLYASVIQTRVTKWILLRNKKMQKGKE